MGTPGVVCGLVRTSGFTSEVRGFPGGSVVKNPPASAGVAGLIPGSGKCPGEGNGNILAWRIPWKEGPGGLQSTRSQRVGYDMEANEQVRWSRQGMKPSDFGLLSSAGEWQRGPPWIQANQLENLSVPSWETLVA